MPFLKAQTLYRILISDGNSALDIGTIQQKHGKISANFISVFQVLALGYLNNGQPNEIGVDFAIPLVYCVSS